MENNKIVYSKDVVRLVLKLEGRGSEIYQAMVAGKPISKMVKSTYKKKGADRKGIKDRKLLFELCKQCETAQETDSAVSVGE